MTRLIEWQILEIIHSSPYPDTSKLQRLGIDTDSDESLTLLAEMAVDGCLNLISDEMDALSIFQLSLVKTILCFLILINHP